MSFSTKRVPRGFFIHTRRSGVQAVVLDEDLDPDFVADIRQYLESLLDGGFRNRLLSLIKVQRSFDFGTK